MFVLGTQHSSGTYDGLMVLGADSARAHSLYVAASETGFKLVDTAPLYARGLAEADLGAVPWKGGIWTKVGIDVESPLPLRNYEPNAMLRSLKGSARRLERNDFEMVWLHNPEIEHLEALRHDDLAELFEGNKLHVKAIGVSVHDDAVWKWLLDRGTNFTAIMVEARMALANTDLLVASGGRWKLAIRGVLDQGDCIRGLDRSGVTSTIRKRVSMIIDRCRPDFLVCGPRTREQLAAYEFTATLQFGADFD